MTFIARKKAAPPETRPGPEGLAEALHQERLQTFKPAFLGRATSRMADDKVLEYVKRRLG